MSGKTNEPKISNVIEFLKLPIAPNDTVPLSETQCFEMSRGNDNTTSMIKISLWNCGVNLQSAI